MMLSDPPVPDLSQGLSPERLRLVRERIRGVARQGLNERRIFARQDMTAPVPLSHAQERLWLLEQLEDIGAAFHMIWAARVADLDIPVLERSVTEIVRRHESLRTRFPVIDGRCSQIVDPPDGFVLEHRAARDAAGEAKLTRELLHRRFDLAAGPLFRARLIHLPNTEYVLVLVMHHIVSDGWSLRILSRELEALYAAFSAGRPSPLPARDIQYADYALWQRNWLRGAVLDRQVGYWQDQLAAAPAALDLPLDRQRPPVQSFAGESVPFVVPAPVAAGLTELGRGEGATLFMVLLAVFTTVLSRWSGRTDIVVGTPVAGRTHRETEEVVGLFMNAIPLRVDVSGDPTFRTLLGRTREVALGGYTHQELPFEKLVEVLKPVRDLARAPVFQVLLALQNLPGLGHVDAGGGGAAPRFKGQALPRDTAKLDLSLYFHQAPGGLRGRLEYATDLFNRPTMMRLVGNLLAVLAGAVATPDCRLSRLPLLREAERLKLFGPDAMPVSPPAASLVARFEATVAAHGPRPALECGEQRWTYDELNAAANAVAHDLVAQRGRGQEHVGILGRHTPETVAAILGVLKAGKCYVPLDPLDPAGRLDAMLRDAGVAAILAEQACMPLATQIRGPAAVIEVLPFATLASRRQSDPSLPRQPGVPAYILFTSGTTGVPKGVLQSDCNIVGLIGSYADALALVPEDRLTLLPRLTFDAAVMDLYGALLSGACLCLYDVRGGDPAELLDWARRSRISVWHSTPTVLRAAAAASPAAEAAGPELRVVVLGGEAATISDLQLTGRLSRGCRLVNGFGPTEVTVATQYHAALPADLARATLPIGRAVAGCAVLLLDAAGYPTELLGEVAVRSPFLAWGYLNRPSLTAERFVPSPFGDGERLYRTGDAARRRVDGTLEFVGRTDGQVKIRGFRVEPGEVEAAVRRLPGVRAAAVVAREDRPGDVRLVAYVVGDAGAAASPGLRRQLLAALPDYMLPAACVSVPALPLTANGKLDRRALPPPDAAPASEPYAGPVTPTQMRLADIWAEVLSVPRVGLHDDFFELGGHSLLATQVGARLRETAGLEMPLRALFEAPTVAELAQRLDSMAAHAARQPALPALTRQERPDVVPLSYAQERLWRLAQTDDAGSVYHINAPFLLEGPLDAAVLERSVTAVVMRHEALRSCITASGAQQRVVAHVAFALEQSDVSDRPPGERLPAARRIAEEVRQRPFDLTRAPLLRGCLIRVTAVQHVFLLVMHHIVSDGWSKQILLREVQAHYAAIRDGAAPKLAPVALQYGDYTLWQRRCVLGGHYAGQVEFWRRTLDGAPTSSMPLDRARPPVATLAGAVYPFTLGKSQTDALRQIAAKDGVTLFMLLLAAYALVLAPATGDGDIVIGSPVAGRSQTVLSPLIGLFMNMVPLRIMVPPSGSFAGLLQIVRTACLEAFGHQEVPLTVVEEALGWAPLFRSLFALQTLPPSAAPLSDLSVRPFPVAAKPLSRRDHSFFLVDSTDGLKGTFEYSTELFDHATAHRHLGQFAAILEAVIADPECSSAALRR